MFTLFSIIQAYDLQANGVISLLISWMKKCGSVKPVDSIRI